ncbi:hypothetical protein HDU84_008723 [Entophlyctis sp. JEL0112]|nr:hypothetical protein HDU84_008723 [Entophlyctis sp. JEL0112]
MLLPLLRTCRRRRLPQRSLLHGHANALTLVLAYANVPAFLLPNIRRASTALTSAAVNLPQISPQLLPGAPSGISGHVSRIDHLRRILSEAIGMRKDHTEPTVETVEQVLRAYLPVTLSQAEAAQLTERDFVDIAGLLLVVAARHSATHHTSNAKSAKPLDDNIDGLNVLLSFVTSCVDGNRRHFSRSPRSLLYALSSLMPAAVAPSGAISSESQDVRSLPPVFDAFARLALADISRMKLIRNSASMLTIPVLVAMRRINSETDAIEVVTSLKTRIDSIVGGVLREDFLYAALITAFSLSQRVDLAQRFFDGLRVRVLESAKQPPPLGFGRSTSGTNGASSDDSTERDNLAQSVLDDCTWSNEPKETMLIPHLTMIRALIYHSRSDVAAELCVRAVADGIASPGIARLNAIWKVFLTGVKRRADKLLSEPSPQTNSANSKHSATSSPECLAALRDLWKSADKLITDVMTVFWARVEALNPQQLVSFHAGSGKYADFLAIVVRAYARRGEYERIVDFWHMMEGKNVIMSAYMSNTILMYLLDQKSEISEMFFDFVISQYQKSPGVLNIHTFNIVIHRLSLNYGGFKKALLIFRTLTTKYRSIKPDVVTYTTVIDICFKAGYHDRAKEFYERMLKEGIRPNVITCTVLIDGLLKSGEIENALKTFQSFKSIDDDERILKKVSEVRHKKGSLASPDTAMYTPLLHKFAAMNEDWRVKSGFEMFWNANSDEEEASDLKNRTALKPDVILFNVLLHYFTRTQQTSYSLALMRDISKHDIHPDSYTATAIIHGLVLWGDQTEAPVSAEKSALRLAAIGVSIPCHAITSLVRAFGMARDSFGVARWVEVGVADPIITESPEALEDLARSHDHSVRRKTFNEDTSQATAITVDSARARLIEYRSKDLDLLWIQQQLQHQSRSSLAYVRPDAFFYTVAITAFLRVDAVACADCVVRHMFADTDARDNNACVRAVVRVAAAWRRIGRTDRAVELERDIGVPP